MAGATDFRLGDSPWAHDGKSLIVCAEHRLLRVQVDGTGATQLTQDPAIEASFSPDGRLIAYNRAPSLLLEDYLHPKDRLSLLSDDGLELRSIELELYGIAWSPDGQWIAGMHCIPRDGSYNSIPRIFLVPTAGGESKDIGDIRGSSKPAWSPDGAHVACYVYDMKTRLDWIEVVTCDDSERVRLTSGRFPCWSRDGHWLALVDKDGEVGNVVFSMAASGGERRALGEGFMPTWSPTDDRLLFTRLDQREQHTFPIVTVRPDGSDERVLTQNGWGGRWSPDGSRVAFLRYSATPSSGELIVANADGSGERSLGELDMLGPTITNGNKEIHFAHYSLALPMGWYLSQLDQINEYADVGMQTDPPRSARRRMQFFKNEIDNANMRSWSAKKIADDYRNSEKQIMINEGVDKGQYQLSTVVMGEETLGGKQFFTMKYTTSAGLQDQSASLYLYFPRAEKNTYFMMAHYSETVPPGVTLSASSDSEFLQALKTLSMNQ